MIDQKLISKLASFASSILLLVAFFYFLPVILVVLGVIMLLVIIGILVFRFALKKKMAQMNFMFNATTREEQRQNDAEIDQQKMKDVTNSSKKK